MEEEYTDYWRIEKFDPAWNPTGMLEVSSFSRRYPHHRETYLQACWQSVKSALKEYGVACELNLVEGSMTVSTTKKTRDPYIIVKARDLLRLLSRNVPAPQAIKILKDDMTYDIINIRKLVRKKERFVRRRQRLVGPGFSTLKALEIFTNCYILVQGNTVAGMGSFIGLKKLRWVLGYIESSSWDPLSIINAEYNRI
ncbi:unnamed protein product [Eruca vesicaria subsp. sativa]|uniref:KRR-R motif-containing protein 1 n=1 Tax=Eruca vesicaria subsp. sativa TaxID=29727 RepID=A0ABC8JEB2_ERUVS|nr:unnamed protein product [Eruca vesicaria subsp. sativa]